MSDTTQQGVIATWDQAAAHLTEWDDEGDFARHHLLNPTIFALAGEVAGRRVLDAGCGNGYLARMLAKRGALVTGVEPAKRLCALCLERERAEPLGVTYLQRDLADADLEPSSFDLAIANMVLMDIPDYRAAMRTLASATRAGGDLIITLLHPCFEEPGDAWPAKHAVETRDYFDESVHPQQAFGVMFHRPLSAYVNALLEDGWRLRRMVEPRLAPGVTAKGNDRDAHVPSFVALYARRSATP